jgi:hypothetical protein
MKITIEQYDHKITYEVPYNDVNMEQMLEILENLLKCTGYCFSGNLEIVDDSTEFSQLSKEYNQGYMDGQSNITFSELDVSKNENQTNNEAN